MDGRGSLYHFVDGDTYIGEFKDGVTHGNITKISSSGYKIVGKYIKGQLVRGVYTDDINGVQYTGDYKNDKFHGCGILSIERRDLRIKTIYEGEF